MINKLRLYGKLINSFITNQAVSSEEYGQEYNDIADTYGFWCDFMGKHVEEIIKLQYIDKKENIRIIDLACGTGYITRRILDKGLEGHIDCVDISKNMLEKCYDIKSDSVKFICGDGIEYLSTKQVPVDAIFCGWALPYLNHKKLLKAAYRALDDGGIIAVISNSQGTLKGIEEIYLKVMEENLDRVIKPMDARIRLPKGVKGLRNWFVKYNFDPLELGEGEEIVEYNTPEELYAWLSKTGVLAGTNRIFDNMSGIQELIIENIKDKKCINGKYLINHRFVYGIFKKGKRVR